MDMQKPGKGAHGTQVTFSSTNVDITTMAKGVRLRALNVDSEAVWIEQGICLDIADSKADVGIEVGVDDELTSV